MRKYKVKNSAVTVCKQMSDVFVNGRFHQPFRGPKAVSISELKPICIVDDNGKICTSGFVKN